MLEHSKRFFALFFAVLILLTGHGLQLSLVPLRAYELGFDPTRIGLIGSAYFAGFVVGCFAMPAIVSRVGHIRAFSVTTTLCGVALLGLLLTDAFAWWAPARVITGFSICGAYLVIENWLNEQSPSHLRGRVLASYTALVLIAMCLGQVILSQGDPLSLELTIVATALLLLAVIPVSLTPSPAPEARRRTRVSLGRVFRNSPTALVGAGLAGLASGVIFTMAPAQAFAMGLDLTQTSLFMIAILIGGAAFQWPAGRYSDTHDRRLVMTVLLVVATAAALAAMGVEQPLPLIALMFVTGGATLSIYPLCLAHANDRAAGNFLEMGTGVLLASGTGSMLGPLGAAVALKILGPSGFFVFLTLVYVVAAGFMILSMQRRRPARRTEAFITAVSSTPGAIEMDPRAHDDPV